MTNNKNLKVISLAVVKNNDGEVLIIRRKETVKGSDDSEFTWGFPGGLFSDFESMEEAAKLSTLEKTGHYVTIGKQISNRKHKHYPVHLHYYVAQLETEATADYIVDEGVLQITWVRVDELKDYFTTDIDPKVAKYLGLK